MTQVNGGASLTPDEALLRRAMDVLALFVSEGTPQAARARSVITAIQGRLAAGETAASPDVLAVLERVLPQHKTDTMRQQIEAAIARLRSAGAAGRLPKIQVQLPDGDTRGAKVWFTEVTPDGYRVSVQITDGAEAKGQNE